MEHWNRRESIRIVTMPVTVILGWPKSLFGFSAGYYEKTQMNFLANPICDKGEILFQLQVSISFFFFFRKLFIYIIIFLWLHWFFVAASGFSSWLQPAGAILCCGVWISHCGDFSFCRAQVLGTWASVVVTQALEHRLSSCSAWA